MKKHTVLLILLLLLVVFGYFYISKPKSQEVILLEITGATQPTPPNINECFDEYSTKDYYCSGDILLYKQCVYTSLHNLEWEIRSENCARHGPGYTCLMNKCVYVGEAKSIIRFLYANWLLVILVILVIIGFIWWKKR